MHITDLYPNLTNDVTEYLIEHEGDMTVSPMWTAADVTRIAAAIQEEAQTIHGVALGHSEIVETLNAYANDAI